MKGITSVLLALSIALFFAMAAPAATFAATFVVNTTNDTADVNPGDGICADASSNCSLRAAISEGNALAGADTITLPAGTYTQSLAAADEDNNAGGDWDIRDDLTINGAGQATTILQAAVTPNTAVERVLDSPVFSTVVVNGITIRHGNKTGSIVTATSGGGVHTNLGPMTINNSTITLNNASQGGGIYAQSDVTLNNVTISANSCTTGGSFCSGGGFYGEMMGLHTVNITGSAFTNNTATASSVGGTASGAGLRIVSISSFQLTITDSSFTGNQGFGGGSNGGIGNGINLQALFSLTFNMTNTNISGNSGTGGSNISGSGLYIDAESNGTLTGTWDKLTVAGNTGNNTGGGIFINLDGFTTTTFNILNSTISGNTGGAKGGGIAIISNATTTVNFLNTTISGNHSSGSGGGVYFQRTGTIPVVTANFNFCTVAGNAAATNGGGLARLTSGTLNLKNSIVAENSGGGAPDIFGTINSQDYNHIQNTTGAVFTGTTANNVTGTDPLLGPLANNGGPTFTQLPGPGSPVFNSIPSGANDCGTVVTTEQRGLVTRASGSGCEKGAVEVTGPWNIGGVVTDSAGRPIRNVVVVLSGPGLASPLFVNTGMLGTYGFSGLPGATYTVSLSAKRFSFVPDSQEVNLTSDMNAVNFTAEPIPDARPPVSKGVLSMR